MDDNSGLPVCPFFLKESGYGRFYCEGAILKPPDRIAKREIVYKYCASMGNYKNCMIYQMLTAYYDRLYSRKE
jgi:hypothetical protein